MIETEKCLIERLENGIIRVETKEGVVINQDDLDENFRIYKDEFKIHQALFLIVFGLEGLTNAASMNSFANPERNKIKKAEALVVKSIEHTVEANFFLKKFNFEHPIKVFNNEEDATYWLMLQNN